MSNKRRYHRIKIKLPLTFFTSSFQKKGFEGSSINISGTGLAFSTGQPVSKGQDLIIKLLLPGDETATVQAEAVWVQPSEAEKGPWFKVGVKLNDNMQYDIKKYLKFYSQELLRTS